MKPQTTEKIKLSNVTLFVTAGPDLELTFESFKRCMDVIEFGGAIFFSEGRIEQTPEWARNATRYINKTGSAQASGFHYFKELPKLMKTTHMLTVDWDAGIIHPEVWTNEFLEYDYIGARWPWLPKGMNIGNGGFCLMSKKLLESVSALPNFLESTCLDGDIGQRFRPKLESDYGIKFASEDLAGKFSYERDIPCAPTFGYHGFFNMPRHVDDDSMKKLIGKLSLGSVNGQHFIEVMLSYMASRKFHVFFSLYERLRTYQSQSEIMDRLIQITGMENIVFTNLLGNMLDIAEERISK